MFLPSRTEVSLLLFSLCPLCCSIHSPVPILSSGYRRSEEDALVSSSLLSGMHPSRHHVLLRRDNSSSEFVFVFVASRALSLDQISP